MNLHKFEMNDNPDFLKEFEIRVDETSISASELRELARISNLLKKEEIEALYSEVKQNQELLEDAKGHINHLSFAYSALQEQDSVSRCNKMLKKLDSVCNINESAIELLQKAYTKFSGNKTLQ